MSTAFNSTVSQSSTGSDSFHGPEQSQLQAKSQWYQPTVIDSMLHYEKKVVRALRSEAGGPAWRREALDRLDSLGRLETGWDSYQAPPPNAQARFNTSCALVDLALLDFPPHRVAPSVEGGIALAWRVGDKDANIEFFNTGEVLTEIPDADGMPMIEDVGSEDLRAALGRIRDWYLLNSPGCHANKSAASGDRQCDTSTPHTLTYAQMRTIEICKHGMWPCADGNMSQLHVFTPESSRTYRDNMER
jgi:hypothetical protein